MYILGDIERISSLCKENVVNIVEQGSKKKGYSKEALKDLRKATGIVYDMYKDIITHIMEGTVPEQEKLKENQELILRLDERMRKAHLERIGTGKCDAKLTLGFNQMLHNVDRMGNSCMNLLDASREVWIAGLFQ